MPYRYISILDKYIIAGHSLLNYEMMKAHSSALNEVKQLSATEEQVRD